MFENKNIAIYSISDDYSNDILIYSGKAQVYKGRVKPRFDGVNSEHSVFESYKVLVPTNVNNTKKGDLIKFNTVTGQVTVKIVNGHEIPFLHNQRFIELTCDLV